MSLIQEFSPLLCLEEIRGKTRAFSDSFLQSLSQSIATTSCGADTAESESFRDDSTAFILKMVAIVSILVAGVTGVSIPLVGKRYQFLRTDSNLFFVAKGFAAGVILATGFVHMLPDAMSDLTNSCLPTIPWSKFPFSGFIAMMAALATLLVDFVGTQYYERKQSRPILSVDNVFDSVVVPVVEVKDRMHAHAAHHRHEHSHGADEEGGGRHAVISQVLELGIVSHSVIIGLTLGVSQTPSAIKPLIGALSFHQFFEGFALGGCISQAQFNTLHSTFMSCFFAVTTPLGIAVGAGISSFYDGNSPRGLVIEGVLDSISAGILVYMALVDLIAADFLTKRMSCNVKLQIVSYFLLFLGAALMSSLAVWA